jgi:hypothetical protein
VIEHKCEDLGALIEVGETYWEALGHAAEDGGVDVVRTIGGAKDENTRICPGSETIPQPDKSAMNGRAVVANRA